MKKSNKLLTFELNEKEELLEIHGNIEGLKSLIKIIDRLIAIEGNDHSHMMSSSWGGQELTDEPLSSENQIINHVKIYKWK